MKTRIISVLAAVLIALVAFPADALAAPPEHGPSGQADFSPGEIVVGFKPGTTLPQMALVHRRAGGHPGQTIPALGVHVVTIPAGTVTDSIRRYSAHPLVAYAEPNYVAGVLAEPDDTYFDNQWGLERVQAPLAWDITTASPGVVIAILDTGVDSSHPDLVDKIIDNVNFTESPTCDDVYGHGTHVAGIAAAATDNGMGVAGLGYDSGLLNVKVLRDDGKGYHSWIAAGITWAADNGADVINMSLGGGETSQLLEDAVNYAWAKGVVVVAAAGNHGNSYPVYPAAYANCMAVAATDQNDDRPSWSAYGDWVAVAAPGTGIYSTMPDDTYAYKAGTSMASPHVAGLAALVFTTVADGNGDGLLNDEVRLRIEATCDDIGVDGIGSGRINAYRAVMAEESETEPEPEPHPDVEIALSADPVSVSQAGTIIDYTYTVTNTGQVDLTGIVVTDDLLDDIALGTTTLAPAESTTGTASYTVTQSDIDTGADIVNTSTVTCDQAVTDTASATVTVVQQPAVHITLSADPSSVSQAGDLITYTYTVTNPGDVTLTGIAVTDDTLGSISLTTTTLAPADSTTTTATYTVTQADIDAGADIINTATVTADQGVTDTASATVTVVQEAVVQIALSADHASVSWAGDLITYTCTVTNSGEVTLTGIAVTDTNLGSISLTTTTLAPTESTSATATYTVTQADIDSGADIVNTATVTADQGVAASDSATVTVVQDAAVQIALSADPASVSQAGDLITYTYTVTNTGEVTLTGIAVTDDMLGSIVLGTTTLAPTESTSATASYTATQGDIDSGSDIVNTATVTADQGVAASDSATVTVVQQPALDIALAADPASVSQAGDLITYTYTITNTGDVTLTGIAVTDDMLGSISLPATTLAPTESTSATATYTVTQSDIDSGADLVNTATVTAHQAVADTASTTVTIEVPEVSGVSISPAESSDRTWAGQDVLYVFTVENTGNVPDTYAVSLTSTWPSSAAPQSLVLDPGATETITVTHSVPVDASPGDFDTGTIQVLSGGTGASASATFSTAARVAAVEIVPAQQSATAAPGETVHYIYTISNTGTEDDVYSIAVSAGWAASLSATSVSVEAGTSTEVIVSHTVPDGAAEGDADTGSLTATSAWAQAAAGFTTTAEPLHQPSTPVIDLFTVSDRSNPAWAWVTVDWAVSDADGDLAMVEIVMVLDGTIVDSVTYSVAGYSAGGTCELRHRRSQGSTYQIVLTVTDALGNTTSHTQSFRVQEKASTRSR